MRLNESNLWAARDTFARLLAVQKAELQAAERLVIGVIERAMRTPRNVADGWPSALGGDGGGGSGELTSVESAADCNVFGDRPRSDEVHDMALRMIGHLSEWSGNQAGLLRCVELVKRWDDDTPLVPTGCELCDSTGDTVWGTVAGLLPSSHLLCRSRCYGMVRSNGGWPTPEQVRHFKDTGKWKVKAA